ncbi:MAG: substrate-binding periplasmic protein [Desulfatibacillaceae bacterium]
MIRTCVILFALAATILVPVASMSAEKPEASLELVIATGEWPPYVQPDVPGHGFLIEVLDSCFRSMGIAPKFVFLPWKRAEEAVRNSDVFAAFPYVRTIPRSDEFFFSKPVHTSTGRLFYLESRLAPNYRYQGVQSLKDLTVGGVLGYWYETPFAEAGLDVEYVTSDAINLAKLRQGRVDVTIMDELMGWWLVRKNYPDEVEKFTASENPVNVSTLHLMAGKRYPAAHVLIQGFDSALAKHRKSGTVERIRKRHGIDTISCPATAPPEPAPVTPAARAPALEGEQHRAPK